MSIRPPTPPESAPEHGAQSPHPPPPGRSTNLYKRVTSSVPALVTIFVHVALAIVAGVFVVQEQVTSKKPRFEASNIDPSANRQVEHRLQVARRGGASGSSGNPVSANRIYSAAADALSLPEMPELPSTGAGGFGGFGAVSAGVGAGTGSGFSTSLGNGSGLGGRGFMSLSFLGSTTQNAAHVAFAVDTSAEIMDLRKGGFRAFGIIREEIMRLVSRLPPTAKFNVVLFRGSGGEKDGDLNLYQSELVPATTQNKEDFFAWMSPVNTKLDAYGPTSAARRIEWKRTELPPESGVSPLLVPPPWSRAVHALLEQKPQVIYVITANAGRTRRRADDETIAKRKADVEKRREKLEADLAKEGLDPDKIRSAREKAYAKARREFDAANRRLVAAGKDPIVITSNEQIFRPDVQAALRKAGVKIELDKTGWTRKDGSAINAAIGGASTLEDATWEDFVGYYARLQNYLLPQRPTLNLFLFVGPNDKAEETSKDLTMLAKRNGGTFQLLTAKRLEELKTRDEAASP